MISNYIFIKATYGLSTCEVQFMEHLYRQEPANLNLQGFEAVLYFIHQ